MPPLRSVAVYSSDTPLQLRAFRALKLDLVSACPAVYRSFGQIGAAVRIPIAIAAPRYLTRGHRGRRGRCDDARLEGRRLVERLIAVLFLRSPMSPRSKRAGRRLRRLNRRYRQ